jgi:hypothetical protein
VIVTGRLIEQTIDDTDLKEAVDGPVHRGTGHRERQVVEWSDPRLPAVKWSTFDYVEYADGASTTGTAVFRGSHLLEDDDGSWVGSSIGVFFADGSIEGHDLLVGRGAYSGLYVVLFSRVESSPAGGGRTTWHGVLCEGVPPAEPTTIG